MYRPEKIISGGQTGADMGGLLAARDLGIRTGGWAAKGWRTEAGPNRALSSFGLVQASSDSYAYRTRLNVGGADIVVVFGDCKSPGSKLTLQYARNDDVPALTNPDAEELREFARLHEAGIVMVAGNRASRDEGIEGRVRGIVRDAFKV